MSLKPLGVVHYLDQAGLHRIDLYLRQGRPSSLKLVEGLDQVDNLVPPIDPQADRVSIRKYLEYRESLGILRLFDGLRDRVMGAAAKTGKECAEVPTTTSYSFQVVVARTFLMTSKYTPVAPKELRTVAV